MLTMPTRKGWTLIADSPNKNGSAMFAARKAAKMPEDYRDRDLAVKNAEALTKQLGFKVHVCECIY